MSKIALNATFVRGGRHRFKHLLSAATLAAVLGSLLAPPTAAAQAWPERTVRFILTFGPGSALDTSARLIREPLAARWKQPLVVDNRPGGDGLVAINGFLGAPDDHTLLYASAASFIAHPYQHEKLPYVLKRDLEPIARVANTVLALSVPTALDVNSLRELVDLIRRQPNKLNIAAAPGLPNLTMASFIKSEKLDVTLVPYRDIVPAAVDLGENRLQLLLTSYAIAKPHVEGGKVKVLAVTTRERSDMLPGVPSVHEQGFPGLEVVTPTGLFGPRGMPVPVRERIAADVAEALRDPVIVERITGSGQAVSFGGPAEFNRALDQQAARAAEVANILGLPAAAGSSPSR